MTVSVLDLDADQQEIFDVELLTGVLKTPKQLRFELRDAFDTELQEIDDKREAGKKDCGRNPKAPAKRAGKIDYAMRDLDKA